MNIGFIGAGKAGTALGRYLVDHQKPVVGYASKTKLSAEKAATFTHTRCFSSAQELASASDLLFISTSDGALSSVWHELCHACDESNLSLKGKIIAHLSGCVSSAVFENAATYGAFVCSAHPLLAFGDAQTAHHQLATAHFSLEGDKDATATIKTMLEELGNKVHEMQAEDKTRYHAAAVFASNLVLAPLDTAVKILSTCGFSEDEAREALEPLIKGNVENFCRKGAAAALTGPVERNDKTTVEAHIESLDSDSAALYRSLTRALLAVAKQRHPERTYDNWNDLL